MAATPANAEALALAATWIGAELGAVPAPPKVHLASAPFSPSPTLDPTTLTEATFDGYAAKTVTAWGTVHLDSSNQATFISASALDWTPTGSTTPNTIYGYWLIDSGGKLVQSETFPTPILLSGTGTTLQIVLQLAVRPWDVAVTVLP